MRDFLRGVRDLVRGFRFWATDPRLMLLGAVPAVIVGAAWVALLLLLSAEIDAVAAWLTPFADDWGPLADLVRLLVGAAVLVAALLVAVLTFTAVVTTVGDPFYERISRAVERRLGDAPPERDDPWLRGVLRAAADGALLLLGGIVVSLGGLLLGLVPVAGPILAVLLGIGLGGWFLAVELTGPAFEVRGFSPTERRRVLRRSRARALGFGAAAWVLFLVPFGAVVGMPAAVGGAVLLSREAIARVTRPEIEEEAEAQAEAEEGAREVEEGEAIEEADRPRSGDADVSTPVDGGHVGGP